MTDVTPRVDPLRPSGTEICFRMEEVWGIRSQSEIVGNNRDSTNSGQLRLIQCELRPVFCHWVRLLFELVAVYYNLYKTFKIRRCSMPKAEFIQ